MKPITYALQFRGQITELVPATLHEVGTAPGCSFLTTIENAELHGRCVASPGDEARLDSELVFLDEVRFHVRGEIAFGREGVLRFHTLEVGLLSRCRAPHLRHGTAMYEVDGGEGSFAEAAGRITNNFFVSDTGEVTSHHLGVVFRSEHPAREETR